MQDQWIEWLQVNRRHFFYGVIAVVAVFFGSFQMYGKFYKPKKHDFFSANQAFEKWAGDAESFEKLEKAIAANPALETKFGAAIADRFIGQGEGEKATPFADSVFNRVLKHTPEHTAFAEGSLMISKGNFREALSQAVSLKERLDTHSLLYGFNLVRIASLYRALEVGDQEIAALDELEFYLNENQENGGVLSDCFREGDVTLSDYILERKSN